MPKAMIDLSPDSPAGNEPLASRFVETMAMAMASCWKYIATDRISSTPFAAQEVAEVYYRGHVSPMCCLHIKPRQSKQISSEYTLPTTYLQPLHIYTESQNLRMTYAERVEECKRIRARLSVYLGEIQGIDRQIQSTSNEIQDTRARLEAEERMGKSSARAHIRNQDRIPEYVRCMLTLE